ncbi:Pyrophosphate--fructose 6-phosphate 1-phosphotransferase [Streptomyces alboniger]
MTSSASGTAGEVRSKAPRYGWDIPAVRGILPRGGTILGSSRTNPLKQEDGVARIRENLARLDVGALIAIGGEDTLGVAARLSECTSCLCRRTRRSTTPGPVSLGLTGGRQRRRRAGCTPPPSRTCGSWSAR